MSKRKDSQQRDLATGELFTRLLLQNQKRIYGLILALVPNGPDADDILQEACSVMWRRFDEFEQGTNFSAWALRIARFQVMAYYTNQKRKRARLSDENVETMIDRLASRIEKADDRSAALAGCLEKLAERDRRLLLLRYEEICAKADCVVVEGAGGWLVPTSSSHTMADLVVELELSVLLVVGLRLGCLNHTLLTAESIERSGCNLIGWIGCHLRTDFPKAEQNIITLRDRLGAPCFGIFPFQENVVANDMVKHLESLPFE